VAGEAALVPELEGQADEGVALGAQECGDGGGVDSTPPDMATAMVSLSVWDEWGMFAFSEALSIFAFLEVW
jgi:hypothetical protein